MGKFNASTELENYASSGGFFTLADEGDSAVMHFMYNSVDDVDGYAVHKVKVPGSEYGVDVNCLRDYEDPLDKCPLCEARYRVQARFFVNLFNEETGEVRTWTRGQNFFPQMKEELGMLKPLVAYPVQIVRHGAKGDKNTQYELIPQEPIDLTMDDVPQVEDPIGTYILDKSYDELVHYVKTGTFDNAGSSSTSITNNNAEVRRRRDVSSSPASRRNTSDGDIPL